MKNLFIKRVQNFVFHSKLFQKGDGIVIGVSGGPDSVALVHALVGLQEKYELKLSLLHVNFGLRGKDSDFDEKFVKKLAREKGLPLKVVRYSERSTGNLEQALREFRYREFEKERKVREYEWIAVGHTLDDQAETVLMNLIRGAGLKGMCGITEKRGCIIRPFLAFEKQEIIEYLKQLGQKFRIDKSNLDENLLRNKIRHSLIPLLSEEYNRQIKTKLANLAKQIQVASVFVEQISENTYNEIKQSNDQSVRFKLLDLDALAPALRSLIFRRSINHLKGDVRNVSAAHMFEFEKMLSSLKSKHQKFSVGAITIERRGMDVMFIKND